MPTVDKRITELTEASSVDLTMDYLAIDNVRDGTRKCKPLDIGAKYSLEQDETDSHVFYFTGTDGTDVTIITTDTIYSITQSGHSFTLVGSNGYEYTVAIPYDSVSMTQAEYDALTPAQKADGTARFITDGESDVESELWSKVGRQTLDTDAQVLSNAVNELKENIDTNTNDITTLNSSLANLVHTQSGSGSYGVNDTLQISSDILAHNIIVICCGRYGYGNSIVLSASSISAGFYTSGIGAYINSSRHVTIKVSTTGLITILETNDALNISILGIC